MAETLVKICGLQDVEVLKSMKRLPLDYVGFVFAPSRRQVTAEQAAELAGVLAGWETGKPPGAAGVFVDPEPEALEALLATVPLAVVQLHGQETPELCREIKQLFPRVKIWKALSVARRGQDGASAGAEALVACYAGVVDALLLDTYDPQERGGSGKTFDWEQIPVYQQEAARYGLPLFIAGGLRPDNVQELLERYAPDGVDVSSGVESGGIKDIGKMTAFVERVKQS